VFQYRQTQLPGDTLSPTTLERSDERNVALHGRNVMDTSSGNGPELAEVLGEEGKVSQKEGSG